MRWRFPTLLLVYVTLDFANPLMPGAVSFAGGSIEVVQGDRTTRAVRTAAPARLVATPPTSSVVAVDATLARSDRSHPLGRPQVLRRACRSSFPHCTAPPLRRKTTSSFRSGRFRVAPRTVRGAGAVPLSPEGARDAEQGRPGGDCPRGDDAAATLLLTIGFGASWVERAAPAGEVTMGKVGRFVTDPKAGAFCQIVLDSGEKILVSHDKGGFKGGHLSITTLKWLGLASGETLFSLDLDTATGKAIFGRLTAGAPEGSARATPLGALVEHVKDGRSVADVRARCAALGD
jgi:hypothetical protein